MKAKIGLRVAILVGGCSFSTLVGCVQDSAELSSTEQDVVGSAAGSGQFPAVGVVRNGNEFCSGTLVNDDLVLTAAHCMCSDNSTNDPGTCATTATFTLYGVHTPDGGSALSDITMTGNAYVHPRYQDDVWMANDYAVIQLSAPASSQVVVTPVHVSATLPVVNDVDTFVGYGNGGADCSSGLGTKRYNLAQVDSVPVDSPTDGHHHVVYDTSPYGGLDCPGDSGGPALDSHGYETAVDSWGDTLTNTNEHPTSDALSFLTPYASCPLFDSEHLSDDFCDPLCPCTAGDGGCTSTTQCIYGNTCVADTGSGVGLPTTDGVCWTSAWLTTFYSGASYSGTSYQLPVGTWDYATLLPNIGNDTISSMQVSPGMVVTLWTEAGCWGGSATYTGDIASLGTMDNQTSCLTIQQGVTLYSSQNYTGSAQTFTPGTYTSADFNSIADNDAESLVSPPGTVVYICNRTPGTKGLGPNPCSYFTGRTSTLGSMNNVASYVQVVNGAIVYTNANYTGTSFTFEPGTYDATVLEGSGNVGNDEISSIIVAPGMKATLCSESDGTGDCKVFTGWNSFVGTTATGASLNDRTSYVKVESL